jgi:hypothetical protein
MTAFPLDNAWGLDLVQPGRTRITVIRAREEFREDLRRYVEGAVAIAEKDPRRRKLPDLALVDSPRFPELALWPQSMNVDPKFGQDYRSMSQLRFLMRVFGSSSWAGSRLPLRLLPLEAFDRAALTALYCDVATGPFLRKYWPQFEPDGKD